MQGFSRNLPKASVVSDKDGNMAFMAAFCESKLKKPTVVIVKYGLLCVKGFACVAALVMSEGVNSFVNGATHGSICWFWLCRL
jgi:hypothetical protein